MTGSEREKIILETQSKLHNTIDMFYDGLIAIDEMEITVNNEIEMIKVALTHNI